MGVILGDDEDGPMRARCIQAVSAVNQPRYTLDDIRDLAREYADEHHNEARLSVQLALSAWLKWLEKRKSKELDHEQVPTQSR